MENSYIYYIILASFTGEASEKDLEILSKWLEKDPANSVEYDKLLNLHQKIVYQPRTFTYDESTAWDYVRKRTIERTGRLFRIRLGAFFKYAAIIAVVVLSGSYFVFNNITQEPDISKITEPTLWIPHKGKTIFLTDNDFSITDKNMIIRNNPENMLVYEKIISGKKKERLNHLIIPRKNTYRIQLSDGTNVWLNAESKLTYPAIFTDERRVVNLTGEAYFEVTHQSGKPFIVHADGMDIEVLGTSFNISSYKKNPLVTTTLVEGSVRVHTHTGKNILLHPSEHFILNKETDYMNISHEDTYPYISWKDGIFDFKDQPLGEILEKLMEWHGYDLTFDNDNLKSKRCTFKVERKTQIDQLVELISFISGVQLEINEGVINVRSKEVNQ